MAEVTHRFVETNGIRMHVAEQGTGPPVVLLHGFPEFWYSWRHRLRALADAELAQDVGATLRRLLSSASGDAPRGAEPQQPVVPPGGGPLDILGEPAALPGWLIESDVHAYAIEFERTGFTGGLNWYRAIDLSWELMAPWQGARVTPPALYVAGDRDLVVGFPGMGELIAGPRAFVPNLTEVVMLPGCGHWTQQERVAEVNAALLRFLGGL